MSYGPGLPDATRAWLLDELATAGRENLDVGHVSRYDAKEDACAADEVALCCELGLARESVLVEFGTGTGQFALAAASVCARVVAVDVSPVMLAAAHTKVDKSRATNVELVHAGFLTYEHHGQPANIVYSRYALHHLPDFWKAIALARIHELLRPGGLLRLWDVVYSFDAVEAADRIEAWCASANATIDDGWSRAELEEHVRDEHSTFTWLLEPMMQRTGFTIEAAEYSTDGMFAKYVARRP